MKDKKKKKGVAVIISIGPKMKTKPTDAATPNMKKYGSMPMKKSWQTLKALPEQKALKILKNSDLRQALANAPDNYALDEIMDATDDYRRQEVGERYARMKAKKDRKIPQRPSPYFPASFPEDKPQELEQPNDNGPYSQIFEDLPQRSVFGKAFEMLKQNYTRDSMPPPRRYDDEGFPEYDGEDLGPPYGKPEFGDKDARQAEMNEAERAAIMAEGMPEMRKPRSAPRPGDPRFRGSRRSDAPPNSEGYPQFFNSDVEDSAHNQPRPRMPKDVFANR